MTVVLSANSLQIDHGTLNSATLASYGRSTNTNHPGLPETFPVLAKILHLILLLNSRYTGTTATTKIPKKGRGRIFSYALEETKIGVIFGNSLLGLLH